MPSDMPQTTPDSSVTDPSRNENADARLEGLLSRINSLASGVPEKAVSAPQPSIPPVAHFPVARKTSQGQPARTAFAADSASATDEEWESDDPQTQTAYRPVEPTSFAEAMLSETQVEALVLKYLFAKGEVTGRMIADQVKLPFGLIVNLLARMKYEQTVAYKDATEMNDYVYTPTDLGRERARRYMQDCSYHGSAPVSLIRYVESVKAQSIQYQNPSPEDLRHAFSDLLINQQMFDRLGPAINSGRGMFLYGYPGNGKTSIAERVTQCFGKHIWIPRAIGVDGEIIRVFDPNHHEEVPEEDTGSLIQETRVDQRWVRVKRPTIIVGGELTMDNLELQLNKSNGTNEAPMQLKSNCGTLVIDDFGRQKMSTDELLNRWIVPLEKRYDFLNLPSGKSIQVPFDQLVIFSTNLEPKDLVDDAFLRRIPYKIEVLNPSEEEFRGLFKIMCPIMGFEYDDGPIQYVIDTHYKPIERPFRCCQPRDLLLQIKNYCLYHRKEMTLSNDKFDFAVENYFAVM